MSIYFFFHHHFFTYEIIIIFWKISLQSIITLLATSWLEKNISLINAVKEQPDDDEEGKFFVV